MLSLVLLVFSFVFSLIAAFWPTWLTRSAPHWGWLAFACFIASLIWGTGGVGMHVGKLGGSLLSLVG